MNYLTNYYRNLSEQLQERINNLEKLIEKRDTENVLVTGVKVTSQPEGPAKSEVHGVLTSGKGAKRGRRVVVDGGNVTVGDMINMSRNRTIGTSRTPSITVPSSLVRHVDPNIYDGPDRDLTANTNEVLRGKTEQQMRDLLPREQLPIEDLGGDELERPNLHSREYMNLRHSKEWIDHPDFE